VFLSRLTYLNFVDDIIGVQLLFSKFNHKGAFERKDKGLTFSPSKNFWAKTNVMTQRYAHIAENKLKGAANALSQALKRQNDAGQVVNFKK
jgi:hypothetical protein